MALYGIEWTDGPYGGSKAARFTGADDRYADHECSYVIIRVRLPNISYHIIPYHTNYVLRLAVL